MLRQDGAGGRAGARQPVGRPPSLDRGLRRGAGDGQATAHVVMDMLSETPVKISRLAHGMPVGGELDYLDDGTILTAFRARG